MSVVTRTHGLNVSGHMIIEITCCELHIDGILSTWLE